MANRIIVKCTASVAVDSQDHKTPLGARRDNSTNPLFNGKLYNLYADNEIKVLDLGCSGGAFVKELIDDGHVAVGIEGSDYSKKMRRAAWRDIPEYLFTCDITKPFTVYDKGKQMKFDVVTSWELMEHIKEIDIPKVIRNVERHLKPNGMWIMSIANGPSVINGIDLHVTKKPKEWWKEMFLKYGFKPSDAHLRYFNKQFIRGTGERPESFHLVVSKNPDKLPRIPKRGGRDKVWEWWLTTTAQRRLKKIIIGMN